MWCQYLLFKRYFMLYDSTYMRHSEEPNSETESGIMVARDWGRGSEEFNGDRVSVCKMKKHWRWLVVMAAQWCGCAECHWTTLNGGNGICYVIYILPQFLKRFLKNMNRIHISTCHLVTSNFFWIQFLSCLQWNLPSVLVPCMQRRVHLILVVP